MTLTSAAVCRVTGVTVEKAADFSGLSEDRRSRQEPFPKKGTDLHSTYIQVYIFTFYTVKYQ